MLIYYIIYVFLIDVRSSTTTKLSSLFLYGHSSHIQKICLCSQVDSFLIFWKYYGKDLENYLRVEVIYFKWHLNILLLK